MITYSNNGNVNTERLKTFVDHIKSGLTDQVTVVRYTTEGDPITTKLEFTGQELKIAEDRTQDKFASSSDRIVYMQNITEKDEMLKYMDSTFPE